MKKFFCFGCFLLFFAFGLSAQSAYKSAIGLRFGYPLSVTYKTMISETNALEFTAGTRGFSGYRWVSATAAYQIHQDFSAGIEGNWRWYYGAGAGAFIYSFDSSFPEGDNSSFSLGLQGYLGLEYNLHNAPVNFTADWVPTFFLGGFGSGFGAGYGSLGVRYRMGG